MTKKHLVEILIKLKNAYPLFYSNRSDNDLSLIAEVWYEHIGGHSEELINRAVYLLIAGETEVPTIALVNRYISKAIQSLQQDAFEEEKQKENVRRLAE